MAFCAQQRRELWEIFIILAAFDLESVQLVFSHALNLCYLASNLLIGFGTWGGCVWPPTFSSEEDGSGS